MSMKNCNDTIEHRNRDLPTCKTVPQQTAPPLATGYQIIKILKGKEM
jgi:hypothetical protein